MIGIHRISMGDLIATMPDAEYFVGHVPIVRVPSDGDDGTAPPLDVAMDYRGGLGVLRVAGDKDLVERVRRFAEGLIP